jgi:O-antigen/teichoic acid export membrane protein
MSASTGGESLRAPDPPLRSQAVVAARWTGVQLVVGRAVTVASTILLARALLAEELGVIAILTVALNAGFLVQEFGTGSALIYRREDEAATAGFVLVFQLGVGAALLVLFVAMAGPVAAFFRSPTLGPALSLGSTAFLFAPLSGVPLAGLEKALDYRRRALVESARAVAQAVTTIGLAFLGLGVWSFVWGLLAGRVLGAVLLSRAWRAVSLRFGRRIARDTLAYGRFAFGEVMLWFVSVNVDDVLVGRMLGTPALGVYKLGFSTVAAPASSVGALTRVAFPAFTRIRDDRPALRRAFLRATEYCAMLGVPLFALIGLLAAPGVTVVYGARWAEAVPVLQVLAPYGMLWVAALLVSDVFKAVGRVRVLFWLNVVRVALLVGGLLMAVRFGVVGVAIVVLAVAVVTRGAQLYLVSGVLGLGARDHVAIFGPTLAATAVMSIVVGASRTALPPLSPLADLLLHGLLGAAVYAVAVLLLARVRALEVLGLMRGAAFGIRS